MAVWRGVTRLGSVCVSCDGQTVCVCFWGHGILHEVRLKVDMSPYVVKNFSENSKHLLPTVWSWVSGLRFTFFRYQRKLPCLNEMFIGSRSCLMSFLSMVFPSAFTFPDCEVLLPKGKVVLIRILQCWLPSVSECKGQEKDSSQEQRPLCLRVYVSLLCYLLETNCKLMGWWRFKIYSCFLPRYKIKLYISCFPCS